MLVFVCMVFGEMVGNFGVSLIVIFDEVEVFVCGF